MNRKDVTVNEFSSKLAEAIKTRFDPEKGTLSAFIKTWLLTYKITDLDAPPLLSDTPHT